MMEKRNDNKEVKFKEQDAPLKNTDNAFVTVKEDGSPGMDTTATNSDDEEEDGSESTERGSNK